MIRNSWSDVVIASNLSYWLLWARLRVVSYSEVVASSVQCVRFGAGRSRVRLLAGSYQDLVNWYCSLAGPRCTDELQGTHPEHKTNQKSYKTQSWRYKTIVVIQRQQQTTISEKCSEVSAKEGKIVYNPVAHCRDSSNVFWSRALDHFEHHWMLRQFLLYYVLWFHDDFTRNVPELRF